MSSRRWSIAVQLRAFLGLVEVWYVSYLLVGLIVYGLGAMLMPLVVTAAGHRPFRVGAVIACQNAGLLSAPMWGSLMDRFGRHRSILIVGCLLIASGFMGLTLYTILSCLPGSAFCIGAGTAATTTATTVLPLEQSRKWNGPTASDIAAIQLHRHDHWPGIRRPADRSCRNACGDRLGGSFRSPGSIDTTAFDCLRVRATRRA